MKRLWTFLGIIIVLVCLSSCGENSTVSALPNYPPEYTVERTWTLKELPDIDGIYKMCEYSDETWLCKISDPAMYSKPREEIGSDRFLHIKDDMINFTIETIKKGKDAMVVKGITGAVCTPVLEMGFTIPYRFSVYDNSIHSKIPVGKAVGGYWEDFEEINGENPNKYINKISDYCNVLKATYGEEFSFGYYSGTEFVEDICVADAFYYVLGNDSTYIDLPSTKTKDGYFVIDFSELSPGYYCFMVRDDHAIIKVE